MSKSGIDLDIKAIEFFREKISQAATKYKTNLNDEVEYYLANMLCDFIDPVKIKTQSGELDILDTPLAILLKTALESPPNQQIPIYKTLGDTSLYLAGFFQEYFDNKCFDLGYVTSIGSSAYLNISVLIRDKHKDKHFSGIYEEMGHKFENLIDLIASVSDSIPNQSKAQNIIRVYERWTRNKSDRLLKILQEKGIKPSPKNSKH